MPNSARTHSRILTDDAETVLTMKGDFQVHKEMGNELIAE